MSEVERIQDQLKRAFEGNAWHGPSVKETLTGVTAPRALQKPIAAAHNIWEIVHHITAWEEAARRRIEGERVQPTTEQDWPAVTETTEAAWNAALSALENSYNKLQATLARLTDAHLEDRATGCEYSIYFLLHGVIQHNLFHAGQISLLKKS